MRIVTVLLIMMSFFAFSAQKPMRPIESLRAVTSDEKGMPLDDGFYNVTFRVYDKQKDGILLGEKTETVESKDGTCKLCYDKLREMQIKGYKQVWVSIKIKNYPESTFRTRIFLNPNK